MLPVPFLVVNDDIMTSLLLLKVIYMLANFLILFTPLLFKYLSLNVYLEGNVDSADKFNNVTSDYIILSIKLSPEVGNDEIIFGGHSMTGFEVIEGGASGALPPLPRQEAKKARSSLMKISRHRSITMEVVPTTLNLESMT